MSAEYRRSRNRHGDPVWTITVTGWHDIFRMSAFFIYQQVEFIDAGNRTLQWMRRSMGPNRFEQVNKMMSGDGTKWQAAITRASKRPRPES